MQREPWDDETERFFHRYLAGKYGKQVQALSKALLTLDIRRSALFTWSLRRSWPLSGFYDAPCFSTQADGIMSLYTSVYGHTRDAVYLLMKAQIQRMPGVLVYDLAEMICSEAISDAFIILNWFLRHHLQCSIYPFMNDFIRELVDTISEPHRRHHRKRFLGSSWLQVVKMVLHAKKSTG